MRNSIHGEWSSHWAFVIATTGSVVGLGSIWRFPYLTGENGGGAFVLVYLLCVVCIGLPVMMAEVLIGRRARHNPITAMRTLALGAGHSPQWQLIGAMGIVAGFLILSFYSVIAGWGMAYIFRTASGMFDGATADGVHSIFTRFISEPEAVIAWHTIFMVMTATVAARGVRQGLERATRYLVPGLVILLLVLLVYAANTGHFAEGLAFLFRPDFHRISTNGVLTAMGQAFFTLSLGVGAIMMYGAYLPDNASIAKATAIVVAADTVIALLAGMVVFPIVFANHLEPNLGTGLVFQTLPLAFGHMPGGAFFGMLFFILLVVAAWTSSISLMEPAVAYLIESRHMTRVKAATIVGMSSWAVGLASVFSFNLWDKKYPLSFIPMFKHADVFHLLDYLTANIMLPLGGVFIAVFAGWFMTRVSTRDELAEGRHLAYSAWRFMVRYVSPAALVIVLLNRVGVI